MEQIIRIGWATFWGTVSYTHLDVYKRQMGNRVMGSTMYQATMAENREINPVRIPDIEGRAP